MLLMVALAVVGSVLHTRHPGWAPLVAALRVASAVLVGLAPGDADAAPCRARGRGRRDHRRVWVADARRRSRPVGRPAARRPGHRWHARRGPLVGTPVAAAPAPRSSGPSRRPFIADAIGVPGSRITSAVVGLWGWRARIRLRRVQTVGDLVSRVPRARVGLGTRPGTVRDETDPARADRALIRVLDADPHPRAIPWADTFTATDERPAITDPVPLGLFEDARTVAVTLTHPHGLIGGVAGGRKSASSTSSPPSSPRVQT